MCYCCIFSCHGQSVIEDSIQKKVEQLIQQNKAEEAINIAIEQLKIAEKKKDIPLQIKWNTKIGKILRNNQNFQTSFEYLTVAKELSIRTNDSLNIANSIFEIGSLTLLEYSKRIYEEQRLDVALDKRDIAFNSFTYLLENFDHIEGTENIFAKAYANLTGMYSYTQEYDKAETSAEKAIGYYQSLKDTLSIIGVKSNLAISQIFRKEYIKAEQNYLEALPLLKDTTNLKILNLKAVNLANLSDIYYAQEKFKLSRDYLAESQELYNIYSEKNSNKTIAEIEARYSEDKVRQEENQKRKQMQLWFGIFGLAALTIIISGLVLYRNSQLKAKNLSLVLLKNELEKLNQIEKLQNETQSKVLSATLDARVNERKQIAQVLHDSVSSLLSSANMHLQVIKKKSDGSIDELDKSQRILGEASDKVRDISHRLISAVLIKFGLEKATQDLCEKHSNGELSFEMECNSPIPRFDQDFEIKIHTIIEEFVNNIIKHSNASLARIELDHADNLLEISIKDNGVGFNSKEVENHHSCGIGLNQIKARIQSLNGKLNILSKKFEGTKIFIEVPTELS